MKFIKMQGAGNDYIYIDCFRETVENPFEMAKELSRYHFSVGADGLVLIKPSQNKNAHCFMDIYNADGSRAKMCGNAIRCTAKYVYDNIYRENLIKIETLSGIKNVEILKNDKKSAFCRVSMGEPILDGHRIPTRYGKSIVKNEKINIANKDYEITCVSMGNPHCVVFWDSTETLDSLNLNKIGPLFENYEMFPSRINTEFVVVLNQNHIKMRVWERGSGETLACGTGACAVAVASVLNGFSKENEDIEIITKGGILTTNWKENGSVMLSGLATDVFRGEI